MLHNNAANVISTAANQNVLLDGRTIFSDGAWNTLCLPFNVPEGASGDSPIPGASVKELNTSTSNFNASTGVLTLNFTDATSIVAGKPYIVKWDEAIDDDLSNPVFLGVNVSAAPAAIVSAPDVDFIGCYSPIPLDADDESVLYLGADNALYYPSANMNINAFRAYFHVNLPESASVRGFVLNFGDGEDSTQGVYTPLSIRRGSEGEAWFTLDGRRLNDMPTARGIYVINGKKHIIHQ